MFIRALYLCLLLLPFVELALFVLAVEAIGFWPALGGIILLSLLGALVLRQQGLALFGQIRQAVTGGRVPSHAISEAMLMAMAGLLLLVPGFLTDLFGLLLLVPALRRLGYRLLSARWRPKEAASRPAGPQVIELDSDHYRPS